MDKILENEARLKIIEIAKEHNWYLVLWAGHWDKHLVVMKNNRNKDPDIYGAFLESFYDIVKDDEIIEKISIGFDTTSWVEVLKKLEKFVDKPNG